jgi:hypothetical protein
MSPTERPLIRGYESVTLRNSTVLTLSKEWLTPNSSVDHRRYRSTCFVFRVRTHLGHLSR